MAATMVPATDRLPEVLPAGRLLADGRPTPDLRTELRRIPSLRNAVTVAVAWAQVIAVIAGAVWLDRWWVWPIAVVLMGRSFALLLILSHESAHRLLFANRRVNDVVGRWLLAAPGLVPLDLYRRAHMAHHRDELGPDEPDAALYAGYPITRASLRRKLLRDAVGISGWKNLRPLLKSATRRPVATVLAVQVVLLAGFTAAGWPQLYFALWLLPWMTSWRVINRLRAIAEHGGMERSPDKRRTTHHVRQGVLARFWMVPYRTGWHLAHHVDAGVPWRNLPRLHRELEAAGWVTPALTWPSYPALWRAMSARVPAAA